MCPRGLLWLNDRNLSYIKKYNPRKEIRLADNKYKSKKFLSQRWIPVPETFVHLRNRTQLRDFSFSSLPDSFVIKPNKWSRWQWIMIVSRVENTPEIQEKQVALKAFTWTKDQFVYKSWGQYLTEDQMKMQVFDFFDGRYSLGERPDTVLIEEKLIPGDGFAEFCKYGLADIRVITFNLVAIAAMVRIPTATSQGKANMDLWWAAAWIDVGSWVINTFYINKKVYKKSFPDPYKHLQWMKLPYWDDVLLYSSSIQYFVNMGYLAHDWVLTTDGPKILEINARAWTKIQNVALVPLRYRLKKVWDLVIDSPEKWVEITKSLFSKNQSLPREKVIYLSQYATVSYDDDERENEDVVVNVELKQQENKAHPSLVKRMDDAWYRLLLAGSWIRRTKLSFVPDASLAENVIVIGAETASRYLIKPIEKIHDLFSIVNPERTRESETHILRTLDVELVKISKRLNLVRLLRPTNYIDELDRFLTRRGRYNPTFTYRWPAEKKLQTYEDKLLYYKEQYFGKETPLVSEFWWVFRDKIDEWLLRIRLLKAYREQNVGQIALLNEKYYGAIEEPVLEIARRRIAAWTNNQELLWPKLNIAEQKRIIAKYLTDRWIKDYRIEVTSQAISRISVSLLNGVVKVKLSVWSNLREIGIYATLAHEIDTHIMRWIHGNDSGWNILSSGTAFYEKTEEWLAVYKAKLQNPEWFASDAIYYRYLFLSLTPDTSFVKLVDAIDDTWFATWDMSKLFKSALRCKRWLENTSIPGPGVFLKDKVYVDGLMMIENLVEEWFDVDKLMIGKVKESDLDMIV